MKMETYNPKPIRNSVKAVIRGRFIAIQAYTRNKRKII